MVYCLEAPMPSSYRQHSNSWIGLAVRITVMLVLLGLTVAVGIDISKRTGRIQTAAEALIAKRRAIDTVNTLRTQSEQAAQYNAFLENTFPAQDRLISFPRELQTIAGRSNLSLDVKFKETTEAKEGNPGSIAFQLTGTGALPSFVNFLHDLETSRFSIAFERIEFSQSGNILNALMKGHVFSR